MSLAKSNLVSVLALLPPLTALAAVPPEIALCSKIGVPDERLACYDRAAGRKTARGPAVPSTEWEYSSGVDEMSDIKIETAKTRSVNPLSFRPPYGGPQRAALVLRRKSEKLDAVIIAIERGQFVCGASCVIEVRFDDGEPVRLDASPPSDGSTEMLFVSDAQLFLRRLRGKSRLRIGATFHLEGRRVLEFVTSGLAWKLPELEPSGKQCRASFDCLVHEKCDRGTRKCATCQALTDEESCADSDR